MRYKTPVGEVDVVASKKEPLVMVEVQARAEVDDALFAVSARTRNRIEDASLYFLSEYNDYSICFDVIAVGGFSTLHLDNAWQARS